jgi:hypothetical protein
MAGNKKPRKQHQKRWNSGGVTLKTELHKVRAVFAPLEAILDQLEQNGTIDTAGDGMPIFKDRRDGRWYCTVTALNGVIEAYEIHERRHKRFLGLDPLRQLSNKLRYSMPIFESDTKAARECLMRMRMETVLMTADYAKQLIKDFQIKEALEKLAA